MSDTQDECPEEPDKSGQEPEGLTAAQTRALDALLQQPTISRAATAAHVHERTLRRWMKEPVFYRALQEARRMAFGQAIGVLQGYGSAAVAGLARVLNDPASPAHCRISAAVAMLKFARDGILLDDLAERVAALEQATGIVQAPAPAQAREEDL